MDGVTIICTATNEVEHVMSQLNDMFSLKDLGNLKFFPIIEVPKTPTSILLSLEKYIANLLCRASMETNEPVHMPVGSSSHCQLIRVPSFPILNYIEASLGLRNMFVLHD